MKPLQIPHTSNFAWKTNTEHELTVSPRPKIDRRSVNKILEEGMSAHHDEWGIWPNDPSEQRNSPAEFIPIQTLLHGEFKRFPMVSMTLASRCDKNSEMIKGTHGLIARPHPAGAPAHSVARSSVRCGARRDDLRCLRYPAASAPVGVSSSRSVVCAWYCGRTLHGPKVRTKHSACAMTVVGCVNTFS